MLFNGPNIHVSGYSDQTTLHAKIIGKKFYFSWETAINAHSFPSLLRVILSITAHCPSCQ